MNQSMTKPLILPDSDIESGGKDEDTNESHNFTSPNSVHNASIKIRMAFIRKVYGLLSMQLFLTVIITGTFCLVDPVKEYFTTNTWPILPLWFVTFGILIALHFKRKEHPTNLVLLVCFTIAQACAIGVFVSLFDVVLVLEALVITTSVVISLTAFTFQTKQEISLKSSGLFSGLIVLLIASLLQGFIFHNTVLELLLCSGGALLFSFFIIYDTQNLMQNLSPEEYILATIDLYLDIINLFLYILRILAVARK